MFHRLAVALISSQLFPSLHRICTLRTVVIYTDSFRGNGGAMSPYVQREASWVRTETTTLCRHRRRQHARECPQQIDTGTALG